MIGEAILKGCFIKYPNTSNLSAFAVYSTQIVEASEKLERVKKKASGDWGRKGPSNPSTAVKRPRRFSFYLVGFYLILC